MDISILTDHEMSAKQKLLIQNAYVLFRKHGIQRISIEEICKKANVSKMTFYKYFTNKDELFMHIIRRIFDYITRETFSVIDSDLPIKQKFDRISLFKQRTMELIGEEMMISMMNYTPAYEYLEEVKRYSSKRFREFIITEQKLGNINPEINIDLILLVLFEINRLYTEHRLTNIFDSPDKMVKAVNELLIYGLLKRNDREI